MQNALYYGDNLAVLREHIRDETVDLVYLDPPFNSNATYNVLFKAPSGQQSRAQIEAFEDTWHWGTEAETAFLEVLQNPRYPAVGAMLQAMRTCLGENDMVAYLAMMAVRLMELHRVLKSTGSIYLHCDPTASHYLKILIDSVFGPTNFRSEIIWKRTSSHNSARRWGPVHDTILFATRSDSYLWNKVTVGYEETYLDRFYKHKDDQGRIYRLSDLTGSGIRNGESGKKWNGFDPTPHGRHWAIPSVVKDEFPDQHDLSPHQWLDLFQSQGLVEMTGEGVGWPHVRRFLDRMSGQMLQDVVTDIPPLSKRHAERLGYPTQKPLALLERILNSSSNEGDLVLDPFCGCGTTIHAAQKLKRNWIGIDVTHLAISLVERRLRDAFPGVAFEVHGTPKDLEGARDLASRDKYQFQWWAVSLVDAVPYGGKKRGADGGIDGWRYMASGRNTIARAIISVKGGENVSVQMVRDLRGVIERDKADAGVFITLAAPTKPMLEEAAKAGLFESPFGKKRHPRLQILTVEALLKGKKPDLPPLAIEAGFKRAEREDMAERDQGSLLLPGQLDVSKPRRKSISRSLAR